MQFSLIVCNYFARQILRKDFDFDAYNNNNEISRYKHLNESYTVFIML